MTTPTSPAPTPESRDDISSVYSPVPARALDAPDTGGHSPTSAESLSGTSKSSSICAYSGNVSVSPTDSFHFIWVHSDDDPINKWEIRELYHLTEFDGAAFTTNCVHMIRMVFTTGWFHTLRVMIESVIEARWKDAHGIKH